MDEIAAISVVDADLETEQEPEKNDLAHAASTIGIIGFVFLAGVIALAANAVITALTIPDYMPGDATDDPFFATWIASVLPFLIGSIGLICGIVAVCLVSRNGEKRLAIRGLVFGILNVMLPIAIAVVFYNFDVASATCGGG